MHKTKPLTNRRNILRFFSCFLTAKMKLPFRYSIPHVLHRIEWQKCCNHCSPKLLAPFCSWIFADRDAKRIKAMCVLLHTTNTKKVQERLFFQRSFLHFSHRYPPTQRSAITYFPQHHDVPPYDCSSACKYRKIA